MTYTNTIRRLYEAEHDANMYVIQCKLFPKIVIRDFCGVAALVPEPQDPLFSFGFSAFSNFSFLPSFALFTSQQLIQSHLHFYKASIQSGVKAIE